MNLHKLTFLIGIFFLVTSGIAGKGDKEESKIDKERPSSSSEDKKEKQQKEEIKVVQNPLTPRAGPRDAVEATPLLTQRTRARRVKINIPDVKPSGDQSDAPTPGSGSSGTPSSLSPGSAPSSTTGSPLGSGSRGLHSPLNKSQRTLEATAAPAQEEINEKKETSDESLSEGDERLVNSRGTYSPRSAKKSGSGSKSSTPMGSPKQPSSPSTPNSTRRATVSFAEAAPQTLVADEAPSSKADLPISGGKQEKSSGSLSSSRIISLRTSRFAAEKTINDSPMESLSEGAQAFLKENVEWGDAATYQANLKDFKQKIKAMEDSRPSKEIILEAMGFFLRRFLDEWRSQPLSPLYLRVLLDAEWITIEDIAEHVREQNLSVACLINNLFAERVVRECEKDSLVAREKTSLLEAAHDLLFRLAQWAYTTVEAQLAANPLDEGSIAYRCVRNLREHPCRAHALFTVVPEGHGESLNAAHERIEGRLRVIKLRSSQLSAGDAQAFIADHINWGSAVSYRSNANAFETYIGSMARPDWAPDVMRYFLDQFLNVEQPQPLSPLYLQILLNQGWITLDTIAEYLVQPQVELDAFIERLWEPRDYNGYGGKENLALEAAHDLLFRLALWAHDRMEAELKAGALDEASIACRFVRIVCDHRCRRDSLFMYSAEGQLKSLNDLYGELLAYRPPGVLARLRDRAADTAREIRAGLQYVPVLFWIIRTRRAGQL